MKKEFKLADGRVLFYGEFGPPNGEALFYFHGFPSSFLEINLFQGERLASEMNIHLIAMDRPGYGDSEGQKGRTLKDWSRDVADLAKGLGCEKFSVLGYSGGGPFALGCAFWIPHRLNKAIVISGMGPADAPDFRDAPAWALLKGPGFLRSMIIMGTRQMLDKNPEKFIASMHKTMPKADREMLNNKQLSQDFISLLKQAFRKGSKGALQDALILRSGWGFSLDKVTHPVELWHGELDRNVSIKSARYVASRLPHCQAHYLPGEGHISILGNRIGEILTQVLEKT